MTPENEEHVQPSQHTKPCHHTSPALAIPLPCVNGKWPFAPLPARWIMQRPLKPCVALEAQRRVKLAPLDVVSIGRSGGSARFSMGQASPKAGTSKSCGLVERTQPEGQTLWGETNRLALSEKHAATDFVSELFAQRLAGPSCGPNERAYRLRLGDACVLDLLTLRKAATGSRSEPGGREEPSHHLPG